MKKLNLISAFYIVTSQMNWGRGIDLGEAFKAAKLKLGDNSVLYVMTTFLFRADTPTEIINNIMRCYVVDSWGNLRQVDEAGLEEGDEEQIETYLAGWSQSTNEDQFKAFKARKDKRKNKT